MEGVGAYVSASVLVGGGLLILWLGLKQRAGTLRRNWLAGLRTSDTMASDEAWHAAHTATAGLMIAAGIPLLMAGAAVLVWRGSEDVLAAAILVGIAATVILVLVAGARGSRIAAELNRRRDSDQSDHTA